MKKTAIAPANIAFIKYWGKKDEELRLPETGSISMSLDHCLTTTTVEFDKQYSHDLFYYGLELAPPQESARVFEHLDRIRDRASVAHYAKVVTQNSFPKGSGNASSASGFAALTVAAAAAAGLSLSEKELSILARIGSGSACRSIPEGFVEWIEGNDSETSYARCLYPCSYWDLTDVLVIVDSSCKKVGSSQGHTASKQSIFHAPRIHEVRKLLPQMKNAFEKKDFRQLGELIEKDTIYMHAVMMSSTPPIYYWNAGTMAVIQAVCDLREEGTLAYFSIDAGPNVHVICEGKNAHSIDQKLKTISGVYSTIINKPAERAHIVNNHLF